MKKYKTIQVVAVLLAITGLALTVAGETAPLLAVLLVFGVSVLTAAEMSSRYTRDLHETRTAAEAADAARDEKYFEQLKEQLILTRTNYTREDYRRTLENLIATYGENTRLQKHLAYVRNELETLL